MNEDVITLVGPLEPRDEWVADRCSIAGALDVVSTRSALLIMREAFYGATRFDEFASRVGISEPVAASRLREKGADLLPVLVALQRWGDKWLADDGRGLVELRHVGCGEPVAAELRCAAGHAVIAGELEL